MRSAQTSNRLQPSSSRTDARDGDLVARERGIEVHAVGQRKRRPVLGLEPGRRFAVGGIAHHQRIDVVGCDEFARLALTPREGEAPEGASLAMLNEKVAESLKREKEQAVKETRRRAVLDGLLALHDVPAPETMVSPAAMPGR